MKSFLFGFITRVGLGLLAGCASAPPNLAPRVSPNAMGMDTFQVDNMMPVREVKPQDFYFKKCSLEGRHPFYSKSEYSCNDTAF